MIKWEVLTYNDECEKEPVEIRGIRGNTEYVLHGLDQGDTWSEWQLEITTKENKNLTSSIFLTYAKSPSEKRLFKMVESKMKEIKKYL